MTFSALDSELVGPLFATRAMRAVFADRARLSAMLKVEAALARAEARFGLAPEELASAIEAIDPDGLDMQELGARTAIAGVPTIPFIAAVRKRLSNELEPAFHAGATTQDILDTALVLQIGQALDLIGSELRAVIAGLAKLATEQRATPCVGRTYGQHAAPITFGFKVAVWLTGVAEAAGQLPALRKRVLVASLAGPVGTLAALGEKGPAVAAAFAEELSLGAAPIAWHALRARMAEAGAWLAVMIGALAKMATDVAHLASTDVGEVAEPHVPGRGGSSAMPHKRNPVSSTIILAAHADAKGHAATLLDAMAAAHERPAGLWHAEWHALPQLFGLASGALREARSLAEGLEVDAGRMRSNLDATKGLLFADAAAGALAPRLGRGEAHKLVEEAADAVRRTGKDLRHVLSERAGEHAAGLDEAFDLMPSVAAAAQWVEPATRAAERILAQLDSSHREG
jgi:3-carboxy-cis,cis-muconate cycloisomerase